MGQMPPPSAPGGLPSGEPSLRPLALTVHRPGSWGLAIAPLAHRDFRAAALARPVLPYGDLSGPAWLPSPEVRGPALEAGVPLALAQATWPAAARAKRGLAAARVRVPAVAEGPAAMVVVKRAPLGRPHRPRLPRAAPLPRARIAAHAASFRREEARAAAGPTPRPAQAREPLPAVGRQTARQYGAVAWRATLDMPPASPREGGGPQPALMAPVRPARPRAAALHDGTAAYHAWFIAPRTPRVTWAPEPAFRQGVTATPVPQAAAAPRHAPRTGEVAMVRTSAVSLPIFGARTCAAEAPGHGAYAAMGPAAAEVARYAKPSPNPRAYREGWSGGIVTWLPGAREARPRGPGFAALAPAAATGRYTMIDDAVVRAGSPRDGWTGGIAWLLPGTRQARPRAVESAKLAPPAAVVPQYGGREPVAVRPRTRAGWRPEMLLNLRPAGPVAAPASALPPRRADAPAAVRALADPAPYAPQPLAVGLAPGPGLPGASAAACTPAVFPAFWSAPPAPATRLRGPAAAPAPDLPPAMPARFEPAETGQTATPPPPARPRPVRGPLPSAPVPLRLPDRVIHVSNLSPAPLAGLLPLDLRWRPVRRLRGGGWRAPAEKFFLEMAALTPWPAGLDAVVREDWRAPSRLGAFGGSVRRAIRSISRGETRP